MFRILNFEFYKIIKNKILVLLLCVFILINLGVSYYTCYVYSQRNIPDDVLENFFSQYKADRENIENDYRLRQENIKSIDEHIKQLMENGETDYEVIMPADKYISSDIWNDGDLYEALFGRIRYIESYHSAIEKVIQNASLNINYLQTTDGNNESFSMEYQRKTIEKYSDLLDKVILHLEYNKGWDAFFSYRYDDIMIFIVLAAIATSIFGMEYSSGFYKILRISKKGSSYTTAAKIITLVLISLIVCLLFTLETWAVYYSKIGFSSPLNSIQIFREYLYCPYDISILEYFIIRLFISIGVCSVYSLAVALISILIRNNIISYILSLSVIVLNYFISALYYINPSDSLRNLNIYSIVSGNSTFTRYQLMNVFGYAIDQNIVGEIFYTLLFITVVALIFVFQNKGSIQPRRVRSKFVSCTRKESLKINKYRRYPVHLLYWEMFKNFTSLKSICIIILIVVKIASAAEDFAETSTYANAVYKEYMTNLSGSLTEEKEQYIQTERDYINKSIDMQEEMLNAYRNKNISEQEYMEYLKDYNYAYARTDLFRTIESHLQYIKDMEADGISAWFLYDTDWKKVIFPNFDWTLLLAQLVFLTSVFSMEYESKNSMIGFAPILRTSVNGRKKTFIWKVLSAVGGSIVLYLIWFSVDYILITENLNLPYDDAPVQSIRVIAECVKPMTIHAYVGMMYAIRFFIYIFVSLGIISLSAILKNNILIISCAAVFTVLPSIFDMIGLSWCGVINYINAYQVTSMILDNSCYIWIYISILLTLNIALFCGAQKQWQEN